ncbi:MAG: hypothetical protein E7617_05265 [Ruminococcaceae bacterium]|nr:hypothetical protein [Oscillospiraceae bacterium]
MYNDTGRKNYVPIMQGVVVFIWTLTVKLTTMIIIYALSYADDSFLHQCPDWLLHTVVLVASLLIYNSALRVIALFDADARITYLEQRDPEFTFGNEITKLVLSRDFIIQSLTLFILFLIASLVGGFSEIGALILGKGSLGTPRANLISTLILPPVLIIIGIFTRYEVRRYWIVLDERRDTDKIEGAGKLLLNIIIISLAYPVVFPLAPLLLFAIFSFLNILLSLFGALKLIGTTVVIILLFFAIYLIPLLRGISKRRKFIKRLKAICLETGWDLSQINSPYRSFFRAETGVNFTIERNGKLYKCAFLSALHKRTPLIFTSDTDAHFMHRIGTKDHHYTINHNIEYGIRGEGNKCIIISTLPKKVLVESDGGSREILPGDRIWDYTIYNMSGFINAIDRDYLDRWNTSN